MSINVVIITHPNEWRAGSQWHSFMVRGMRNCVCILPRNPLTTSTEINWDNGFFESLWSKGKSQENGSGIFELSGKQGFQGAMPLYTKMFPSKNPYFFFFIFSMKNFDYFKNFSFKSTALYARTRSKRDCEKRWKFLGVLAQFYNKCLQFWRIHVKHAICWRQYLNEHVWWRAACLFQSTDQQCFHGNEGRQYVLCLC